MARAATTLCLVMGLGLILAPPTTATSPPDSPRLLESGR